jgi:hypothetical protein
MEAEFGGGMPPNSQFSLQITLYPCWWQITGPGAGGSGYEYGADGGIRVSVAAHDAFSRGA